MTARVSSVIGGLASNAYTSSRNTPYAVATEIGRMDVGSEGLYKTLKTGKPLEKEDVAGAALYLAGDLIIDGGFTAVNRGLAFFEQP